MTDLIERLRFTHEHGIFDAVAVGKSADYGEAADRIERDDDNTRALLARIAQLEADKVAMTKHLAQAQRQYAALWNEHNPQS